MPLIISLVKLGTILHLSVTLKYISVVDKNLLTLDTQHVTYLEINELYI